MKKKQIKSIRDYFISYLNAYGGDAKTMEMSSDLIVSFAGSDGPTITESGLKEGRTFISFTNTEKIDEYLVDGCSDNYFTQWEDHAPTLPIKSWTDYYKEHELWK